MLKIRKATAKDAEVLIDLYGNHLTQSPPKEPQHIDSWQNKIAKFETDPMYNIFVGEIDGRVASSATLVIIENLTRNMRSYAIIENVVTHTNFRGKGYAKSLIQKATEVAAEQGCYKIMLLTGSKEKSTLRFYENCGFNCTDKTGFVKWIVKPLSY
ncbi:MAG: GNAT family N-acetyltransferase [Defluviitaleaceae bacterium]|nr:GNAT family N-acetyltransferase [Defluviitaleaceae bacterium]